MTVNIKTDKYLGDSKPQAGRQAVSISTLSAGLTDSGILTSPGF